MFLFNNKDYIAKIEKLETEKIELIKENSKITIKLETAQEKVTEKQK